MIHQQRTRACRARHQGTRGEVRKGLTTANFKGCNGHETKEGGAVGQKGETKPPGTEKCDWWVRVRGAEASNGLGRKGRLDHEQSEDEMGRASRVKCESVGRWEGIRGRPLAEDQDTTVCRDWSIPRGLNLTERPGG